LAAFTCFATGFVTLAAFAAGFFNLAATRFGADFFAGFAAFFFWANAVSLDWGEPAYPTLGSIVKPNPCNSYWFSEVKESNGMALISVDEALAKILTQVVPLEGVPVEIERAIGRVASRDVMGQRTLPPWNNSAMDGYAVRCTEITVGTALPVSQKIFAGDRPGALTPGTCARIMTGAPLPEGADAVVMQEKTAAHGELVRFDEAPRSGANVRRRGEDLEAGARLFSSGRTLSLADAGALWGQGLTSVEVHRAPSVAIASSGDELANVGSTDLEKIIDSNTPVISAAVTRLGATSVLLGRALDTLESQRALFEQGLGHDVLITIAGASVGEKDFTRAALTSLGVEIDFWKVAMKPGKPLAFGRKGRTLVFGLPGNPVSAMVTFELFVRPALRRLLGLPHSPAVATAKLAAPVTKPAGLRHFVRAFVEEREGAAWAVPLNSQSSGSLSSAAGASCLIDLGEAVTHVEKGNEIRVLLLPWI
jgi:molybdopterin molybdotransferase